MVHDGKQHINQSIKQTSNPDYHLLT